MWTSNTILSVKRTKRLYKILHNVDLPNPFFDSNNKLRSSDVPFKYKGQELENIEKSKDIYFFIDIVKLNLFDFQIDWIKNFNTYRFNLFGSPRQMGSSIISMYYIIHHIIINKNSTCLLIDNKSANDFIEIYKTVPFYLQVGIKSLTQNKIEFDNGSSIILSKKTQYSQSKSFDVAIICDPQFDQTKMKDIFPNIGSSANSRLNLFILPKDYSNVNNSVPSSLQSFKHNKYYWSQHPNRDINWYNSWNNALGNDGFKKEYGETPTLLLRKIKINNLISSLNSSP